MSWPKRFGHKRLAAWLHTQGCWNVWFGMLDACYVYLDDNGLSEHTLVIFLCDNGGAYSSGDIRTYDQQVPWDKDHNPFASNGWSYLKNTPNRWYKSCAQEGGVRLDRESPKKCSSAPISSR